MGYITACIDRGRYAWAAWLPVIAVCSYALLVAFSASGLNKHFSFNPHLTSFELACLFVVTPIFFTKYGNLFALALTVYLSERFFFRQSADFTLTQVVLLAQTTILAVLADRMPWVPNNIGRKHNVKLNEALVQLLALASIIATLYTLTNLREFQFWAIRNVQISLSQGQILLSLLGLIGLWLAASLNYFRTFALLLVSLPGLLVLGFAFDAPISVLITPFVLGLALSLTPLRRRYLIFG